LRFLTVIVIEIYHDWIAAFGWTTFPSLSLARLFIRIARPTMRAAAPPRDFHALRAPFLDALPGRQSKHCSRRRIDLPRRPESGTHPPLWHQIAAIAIVILILSKVMRIWLFRKELQWSYNLGILISRELREMTNRMADVIFPLLSESI
jgi:hypothetical protein